ncbi:MAG: MoaD/ThiS family protein [Anaerolineae bacterium]|nr:MoaD/ThiS family protein [Anaerolineae bacterium]
MLTVQVRLFATLRRHFPDLKLGEAMSVELPDGATVGQLIAHLGLPPQEIKTVFVNNLIREMESPLADGDVVGIFPPVGGG